MTYQQVSSPLKLWNDSILSHLLISQYLHKNRFWPFKEETSNLLKVLICSYLVLIILNSGCCWIKTASFVIVHILQCFPLCLIQFIYLMWSHGTLKDTSIWSTWDIFVDIRADFLVSNAPYLVLFLRSYTKMWLRYQYRVFATYMYRKHSHVYPCIFKKLPPTELKL